MSSVVVGPEPHSSHPASARRPARQAYLWILFTAAVIYLCLAFTTTTIKTPWDDEGWIASAPANWARTGSWGSPSLDPTGSWLDRELTGIREVTYWNMPVALFVQGVWYKLVGVSLFTVRSVGILFGLLALMSWFIIVSELSGSRLAGSLTALFLAVDYTFLWGAADGRMDMMCAGFGAAGIACYLLLRERRWELSLWIANALLALALFTHPNGVMPVLAFMGLLLWRDRGRLRWRDATALIPYLAMAAVWELYILRRPDLFRAQFNANANPYGGVRWTGLLHPWEAFRMEIVTRYLFHYGFRSLWGGPVPGYTLAIPFLYWLGLCGAAASKVRALVLLALLYLAYMTLFVGAKSSCYLVHILPLYAGVLAAWTCALHQRRSPVAPASLLIVLALLGVQAGSITYKIHHNTYANEYLPVVRFVEQHAGTVAANSYFGFHLGFDRVRDDARIGYYSGLRPDLVIEDTWYRRWWNLLFEPEVNRYVANLLTSEYRLVFERGPFRVYERRRT
jgi:4-amino-4-deoxy-L-arabinose transferase-like glycosyltransferase